MAAVLKLFSVFYHHGGHDTGCGYNCVYPGVFFCYGTEMLLDCIGIINSYFDEKNGFIDKDEESRKNVKFVWKFSKIVLQCPCELNIC